MFFLEDQSCSEVGACLQAIRVGGPAECGIACEQAPTRSGSGQEAEHDGDGFLADGEQGAQFLLRLGELCFVVLARFADAIEA